MNNIAMEVPAHNADIRVLTLSDIDYVGGAGDGDGTINTMQEVNLMCLTTGGASLAAGVAGFFVGGPIGAAIGVGGSMLGLFSFSCSTATYMMSS